MTRRIAVPEAGPQRLLDRVDYADAFTTATDEDLSPREWCARMSRRAHPAVLAGVRAAHARVGRMDLVPTDDDHPLGWRIVEESADHLVLGVESDQVTPRVVLSVEPGAVTLVTLLRYDGVRGRAVWLLGRHVHRAVARYLLAVTSRP